MGAIALGSELVLAYNIKRVMQILGNGGLEVSRCWVHKTANVLNKLPKCQQSKAKRAPQEIWMAETKKDTLAAFDAFIETWGVKYDKAVECLIS